VATKTNLGDAAASTTLKPRPTNLGNNVVTTLVTLWPILKKDQQHMTRSFPKQSFLNKKKGLHPAQRFAKKYSLTTKINLHLGASTTAEGCFFPSSATTATARFAG